MGPRNERDEAQPPGKTVLAPLLGCGGGGCLLPILLFFIFAAGGDTGGVLFWPIIAAFLGAVGLFTGVAYQGLKSRIGKRMILILSGGISIALLLGAGMMVLIEGKLVTTEPTLAEVAGRYDFSRSAFGFELDSEIRKKGGGAYIQLNPDGSVILNKLPVVQESNDGTFSIREYRSSPARFSIMPLGSTASSVFYGIELPLPDPMDHPRFKRKGEVWMLSFEYFNGDFLERMVFTRISEKNP